MNNPFYGNSYLRPKTAERELGTEISHDIHSWIASLFDHDQSLTSIEKEYNDSWMITIPKNAHSEFVTQSGRRIQAAAHIILEQLHPDADLGEEPLSVSTILVGINGAVRHEGRLDHIGTGSYSDAPVPIYGEELTSAELRGLEKDIVRIFELDISLAETDEDTTVSLELAQSKHESVIGILANPLEAPRRLTDISVATHFTRYELPSNNNQWDINSVSVLVERVTDTVDHTTYNSYSLTLGGGLLDGFVFSGSDFAVNGTGLDMNEEQQASYYNLLDRLIDLQEQGQLALHVDQSIPK